MPLLPGAHGQLLTYLFEDFHQRDATGIGAIDDALGVLEAKAHHSWMNYRRGNAAGTNVRAVSIDSPYPRNDQPTARPPAKQPEGRLKKRAVSLAPACSATRGVRLPPQPLLLLSSPHRQDVWLPLPPIL